MTRLHPVWSHAHLGRGWHPDRDEPISLKTFEDILVWTHETVGLDVFPDIHGRHAEGVGHTDAQISRGPIPAMRAMEDASYSTRDHRILDETNSSSIVAEDVDEERPTVEACCYGTTSGYLQEHRPRVSLSDDRQSRVGPPSQVPIASSVVQPLARLSTYANGLRSLLTVDRPSTLARSVVVPRPLNRSSTEIPRSSYF